MDKIDPLSDEPIGAIVHKAAAALREAEQVLRDCLPCVECEESDDFVSRVRALIG